MSQKKARLAYRISDETRKRGYAEVAAWRQGKPLVLVMLAEDLVLAAGEFHQAMGALRSPKGLPRLASPGAIDEWLSLYRDHHRLADVLGMSFGFGQQGVPTASGMSADFRRLQREAMRNPEAVRLKLEEMMRADPEGFQRGWAEITKFVAEEHNHFVHEAVTDATEFDDGVMEKWTSGAEVQFFLRVWFPCFLEYRCYPVELLRAARGGDLGALEDLLRLDKSVIFEPRIAKRFHQTHHSAGRKGFRLMVRGLGGRLRGKATCGSVKCALAGLISEWSKLLKHPLNAEEIRAVFDAFARTRGELVDGDLPGGPETFAKAIQRQRRPWAKLQERADARTKVV